MTRQRGGKSAGQEGTRCGHCALRMRSISRQFPQIFEWKSTLALFPAAREAINRGAIFKMPIRHSDAASSQTLALSKTCLSICQGAGFDPKSTFMTGCSRTVYFQATPSYRCLKVWIISKAVYPSASVRQGSHREPRSKGTNHPYFIWQGSRSCPDNNKKRF